MYYLFNIGLLISLVALSSCGKQGSLPVITMDENGQQYELFLADDQLTETVNRSLEMSKAELSQSLNHDIAIDSVVLGLGLEFSTELPIIKLKHKNVFEFHYKGGE